jgi:hypothetical protein
MKQEARLVLSILAGLMFATASHADTRSVFSFKGSNPDETIQGVLVLNLDAPRTTTATGFSFETPVDFLHYTVRDATGVFATFTLTADNPNTLTITKGTDGSTRFLLLVEPVPTDPPFPGPPAFLMEFTYPGDAPWGDSVPDRTIEGVTDVSLGAFDLFDQFVSIEEVAINELARQLGALNAELRKLRKDLAKGAKD